MSTIESTAVAPDGGPVTAAVVPPERWDTIGDWDEVVASMTRPSVFLTRDWTSSWWQEVGAGTREALLVQVTASSGRTLGLVPFTLCSRPLAGGRLGLMGDELVGSEYLGAAARPGTEGAVASAAVSLLDRHDHRWASARLSGGRPADPAAVALHRAVGERAGRSDRVPEPCTVIDLPEDTGEWWAALGGSFRRRIRQRRRRLEGEHEVVARTAGHPDDVALGLDRLFRLHQARWARRGMPGSFSDPRMGDFYRRVGHAFLDRGWLRLWLLEVDGAVRAVQFGFAHRGTLYSLQEAYDSAWQSPGVGGLGVVLRSHAIEGAIAEGLDRYDFLGGDEPHKQRWGAHLEAVHTTRVARAGVAGGVAWATTFAVQDGRDRVAAALPPSVKAPVRRAVERVAARRRPPPA